MRKYTLSPLLSGGWLTLLAMTVRLAASCPPSCSACSPDVTLCHRLTYIPESPVSTRALMVTDGFILTVEGTNLSLLNAAVLMLSRNCITDIGEGAFHRLPGLQTLLLEHNQISSPSITSSTFQELRKLQVLALSSNLLESVQGTWFRNTKGLLRLLLNGNRIRNLTENTFVGADLAALSYLDLSNNFISYLGEGAFRALPKLQEVDLSRNGLAHIPDVFAPLTRIILQGLDRKEWRCTCDLHPLAFLFRNSTTNSSAPRSGGGEDLTCQSPAVVEAVAAYGVLRRSEADCDYKSPNVTLVFKDKTGSPSGKEVAQVTILCFAGAVGLTCLILAILNWKLQRGRTRSTSQNPCCRALGRALCSHEPRNSFTEGYCHCHLTQENEIQVMSIVGSGKEGPLLQKNCHPAMLERVSESASLKTSFRNLPQGKGGGPDNASFSHFNCRLVRSGLLEHSGNVAVADEAGPPTRNFQRRVGKLRHSEPGKIQTQTLQWRSERTMDIGRDTLNGRGSAPTSALAPETLDTRLTEELWQPPTETRQDSFQTHQHRHLITGSSIKPHRPSRQSSSLSPHSHYPRPHGPQGESNLPQEDSFICKYVPCDQLQCRTSERRANYRERLKSHRNQIQGNSTIKGLLSSRDNMGLPTRVQKPHVRKRVSFHIPDLDEEDGLALLLTDSTEAGALWTPQQNPWDRVAVCHSEKPSKMQEKTKGGKCSSDAQIPEKEQTKASYPKTKVKGQNLNIKLNLHPFRKLRIHPEKQPDREKCPPKSSRRVKKIVQQKLSKVSEEQADWKESPRSLVGLRGGLEQTESSENGRTVPQTLTPNAADTQVSGGSQRLRRVAPAMSGVSRSPREHAPHSADQAPGQGHAEAAASPTSPGIPAGSPPQSSPKQRMESAVVPSSLVLSSALGAGQGPPTEDVKPQHFQADQVTQETTEAGEGHTSQHILGQKEKDDSVTSRNETQPVCDVKSDTNPKDLNPEETLPCKLQHSHYAQLETEEDVGKWNTKVSSQVTKCHITNGGPKCLNKNDSRAEFHDSSLTPQTQSNSDITFVETNFIPHQNRLEFSNDINTPLIGTQTNWHPASRSRKGTGSANGLSRYGGSEAPREKMGVGEDEETVCSSNANHGAVIQDKEMALAGIPKETWESQKNGKSELQALLGSSLVMQNGASRHRSLEVKARLLPNETGPQLCTHMMRKHVQNAQDIGPEEDDDERGEDIKPPEKHGDASFLPEVKDSHFEAENEVPRIPCRVNDAENSAADPPQGPPSAEYANPSPLAAEQSEPNNSNNNGFLP
ncbi:leucine-rich repeat-containing protein 53 [Petaurus breviceps papuanus]|uniref:leucine-rich repeat-containing protein 53 n=1 Tax=Petaurus breviceps papuanus TaxID=3040969 RepID=UPI0036D90DCF